MTISQNWWLEVDNIIERKSLLKHPFYQAWNQGSLTKDDLAYYAEQYYQQESRFPRYVSAIHSICPDVKVRQMLLENLNHEEAGEKNHAELWLGFAESVGASRGSVLNASMSEKTEQCVSAFESLSRDSRWALGLAALYAYEAQQPAVAATKIDGLKKFYGLDKKEALEFFEVHQEMDAWHSASEKEALLTAARRDPGLREEIKGAVSQACDALNALLDGVCETRGIACAAHAG